MYSIKLVFFLHNIYILQNYVESKKDNKIKVIHLIKLLFKFKLDITKIEVPADL